MNRQPGRNQRSVTRSQFYGVVETGTQVKSGRARANLIALRMANDRRIWWRFHLYSIPMLLWAALVGYVLLVILPAN